jgi:dTDP-4-amino-4,6-dideoxygalactose transaminase
LGEKVKKIPFVDLKAQYKSIGSEIDEAMAKVVTDCAFISGKYVHEFEENFAAFCGAKKCVAVGNGTDAIFIALKALGIGPGDEVIVPANTFVATSEVVTLAGAKVVFVDCDPETYNINVNLIESAINPKIKAVIPVHLYGQPADMIKIREIADNYGLKIVQDCAQAHGATIDSSPLVNYGDILCYSFYPGKNLGAYGDAGAIVTNDNALAMRARMIANHGRIGKYDHEFEGTNSRMDGLQGAILNVKLRYLSGWTRKRKRNAASYNRLLENVETVVRPYVMKNVSHVYHLYVIRIKRRNELQGYLKENGVSVGIHYPAALPNLKAYKYLQYSPDDFPVASQYQDEILSLPMYPELTEQQIDFITEKVSEFFGR